MPSSRQNHLTNWAKAQLLNSLKEKFEKSISKEELAELKRLGKTRYYFNKDDEDDELNIGSWFVKELISLIGPEKASKDKRAIYRYLVGNEPKLISEKVLYFFLMVLGHESLDNFLDFLSTDLENLDQIENQRKLINEGKKTGIKYYKCLFNHKYETHRATIKIVGSGISGAAEMFFELGNGTENISLKGKDQHRLKGNWEESEGGKIAIDLKNATDMYKRWTIYISDLENNDFHEKMIGFYSSIYKVHPPRAGGIYMELVQENYGDIRDVPFLKIGSHKKMTNYLVDKYLDFSFPYGADSFNNSDSNKVSGKYWIFYVKECGTKIQRCLFNIEEEFSCSLITPSIHSYKGYTTFFHDGELTHIKLTDPNSERHQISICFKEDSLIRNNVLTGSFLKTSSDGKPHSGRIIAIPKKEGDGNKPKDYQFTGGDFFVLLNDFPEVFPFLMGKRSDNYVFDPTSIVFRTELESEFKNSLRRINGFFNLYFLSTRKTHIYWYQLRFDQGYIYISGLSNSQGKIYLQGTKLRLRFFDEARSLMGIDQINSFLEKIPSIDSFEGILLGHADDDAPAVCRCVLIREPAMGIETFEVNQELPPIMIEVGSPEWEQLNIKYKNLSTYLTGPHDNLLKSVRKNGRAVRKEISRKCDYAMFLIKSICFDGLNEELTSEDLANYLGDLIYYGPYYQKILMDNVNNPKYKLTNFNKQIITFYNEN